MIHQGTLRYFSEKNPERPSGVRFFSEKFLAASVPNIKGLFRKKEKKLGGLRSVGGGLRDGGGWGDVRLQAM
ncbi:hypothetical protein [Bacteroides sp. MSB163]|uniref:hypothetical protein n=1 Tax=Bacteroides maternus TaxID=3117552 RepID=UPI002EDAC512